MPTTPGLNIPDPVTWDRVMAAFNSSPTEYKAWLKEAMKVEVLRRETLAAEQQVENTIRVKRTEIATLLDGAT